MYTMLELISPSSLRPGDVLLSYGGGALRPIWSWAQLLYGHDYTQVAYWEGRFAIEVGETGARARAVHDLIDEHEYTDVFRFAKDGIALGGNGWDPAPLHRQMRSLLEAPFRPRPLAALALLLWRRGPCLPGRALEEFLDSPVARALESEVKEWERTDERPVVGSERLAWSFHDATPDCRFGLRPPAVGPALWPAAPLVWRESASGEGHDSAERHALIERCASIFAAAPLGRFGNPSEAVGIADRHLAQPAHACCAGAVHPLAERTLPRDFARSPDLRLVGRLR